MKKQPQFDKVLGFKEMQNALKDIVKVIEKMQDVSNKINYPIHWVDPKLNLSAFLIELEPEYQLFIKEYGWLGALPACMLDTCYNLYKEEGPKAAWNELERFFQNRQVINEFLRCMGDSELMRARISIVTKGFDAHINGDFVSSIYILLPQVEGLIWDIGVKKGIVLATPNSRVKIDESGQPIIKINSKGKMQEIEWKFGELVSNIWASEKIPNPDVIQGYRDEDFSTKMGGYLYSDEFRHKILHGRDISIFSSRNSTLIIFCLISIYEKMDQLKM